MVNKPTIGITVSMDKGKIINSNLEYLYVKRGYSRFVKNAFGDPILITPDTPPKSVLRICDGIVISGGEDLPPSLYGEGNKILKNVKLEYIERIKWEKAIIDLFYKYKKPILGICYGMQLLNVHFGGTLYQDINTEVNSSINHIGNKIRHMVYVKKKSFLYDLIGVKAKVSSSHHQAVKRIAPVFSIAAKSSDGIIEALESKYIYAIEWHPESDETGKAIYLFFIKNVKQRMKKDV